MLGWLLGIDRGDLTIHDPEIQAFLKHHTATNDSVE